MITRVLPRSLVSGSLRVAWQGARLSARACSSTSSGGADESSISQTRLDDIALLQKFLAVEARGPTASFSSVNPNTGGKSEELSQGDADKIVSWGADDDISSKLRVHPTHTFQPGDTCVHSRA